MFIKFGIKSFVLGIFIIFFSAMQGVCVQKLNTLSNITVTSKGDSYILTLGFKDKYKDAAFIQKQEDGFYYIFIPDTTLVDGNLKIKDKLRSGIIKPEIDFEQRAYVKYDNNSEYVRLDVYTPDDMSVTVLSEHIKNTFVFNVIKSLCALFFIILVALTFFFSRKYSPDLFKGRMCNTYIPESLAGLIPEKRNTGDKNKNLQQNDDNNVLRETLTESSPSRLIADKAAFKCFDIPDKVSLNTPLPEMKISHTSTSEKVVTLKRRNPLTSGLMYDLSEFALPYVSDYETASNNPEKSDNILEGIRKSTEIIEEPPETVVREASPVTSPALKNDSEIVSVFDIAAEQRNNETLNLSEKISAGAYKTSSVLQNPINDKTTRITPEHAADSVVKSLNITPSKGFILKRENEKYNLYSFSGNLECCLKSFDKIERINLQARFYDQNATNDIYIVRLDNYKAMVEFSPDGIKELAVL